MKMPLKRNLECVGDMPEITTNKSSEKGHVENSKNFGHENILNCDKNFEIEDFSQIPEDDETNHETLKFDCHTQCFSEKNFTAMVLNEKNADETSTFEGELKDEMSSHVIDSAHSLKFRKEPENIVESSEDEKDSLLLSSLEKPKFDSSKSLKLPNSLNNVASDKKKSEEMMVLKSQLKKRLINERKRKLTFKKEDQERQKNSKKMSVNDVLKRKRKRQK